MGNIVRFGRSGCGRLTEPHIHDFRHVIRVAWKCVSRSFGVSPRIIQSEAVSSRAWGAVLSNVLSMVDARACHSPFVVPG